MICNLWNRFVSIPNGPHKPFQREQTWQQIQEAHEVSIPNGPHKPFQLYERR